MSKAEAITRPPPDDDRLLLRDHLDGDEGAFPELISRHGGAIYGLLGRYGLSPEERDDVFQEVFVRVHRAAAAYRPDRPLKPWLFAISVNTARSWITRKRAKELPEDRPAAEHLVDPAPTGAAMAEANQTARILSRALDGLPLEQRECVLLCGVQQLPYDEAASILEIPLNTLKSRLRRGRIALARALADSEAGR